MNSSSKHFVKSPISGVPPIGVKVGYSSGPYSNIK